MRKIQRYVLAKRVTTAFMGVGLWLFVPALAIYILFPGAFESESGPRYGYVALGIGAVLIILGFVMRLGVWLNLRSAST